MAIHLEQIYKPGHMIPVMVIDCRVHLFRIMSAKKAAADYLWEMYGKLLEGDLYKNWLRCQWSIILNNPAPYLKYQPRAWQVCVVDDFKRQTDLKYWRADIYPDYKGNRQSQRCEDYKATLTELLQYLAHADMPMYRQECFEADDWGGAVARAKREGLIEGRDVFLSTSDYDWQQLISNKHGIYWSNALPYKPRLRSDYEMLKVHADRGIIFSKPSDIIAHKMEFGDAGDNIFPGAPREVIDLIDPPQKPDATELNNWLSSGEHPNTNNEHLRGSIAWLVQNDFKPFAY